MFTFLGKAAFASARSARVSSSQGRPSVAVGTARWATEDAPTPIPDELCTCGQFSPPIWDIIFSSVKLGQQFSPEVLQEF